MILQGEVNNSTKEMFPSENTRTIKDKIANYNKKSYSNDQRTKKITTSGMHSV